MRIYVGIDDTDNLQSRGTGRLARAIASAIAKKYTVYGVTRHQLYVHPDVPFTSHNSCAVIHVDIKEKNSIKIIFEKARQLMCDDFVDGSDPGLAVAPASHISPSLVAFGKDAKNTVLTQKKARSLAHNLNIRLEGLGGTEDGVIGAMAGIGLASTGNDGRFIQIGRIRDFVGSHKAEKLMNAGIDGIFTLDGRPVTSGMIFNDKNKSVKPCLVNGKAILFVHEQSDEFEAIKRD